MNYRRFGRTNWKISEIGYGMWGMGEWKGSEDQQSGDSLDLAVAQGVNFFDTAWAYGDGKSETLLADLLKRTKGTKIYTASKIPPKNRIWPSKSHFELEDVFPADYIKEYTEKSLQNIDTEQIDLMQFHVWEDSWANREEWQRAVEDLKKEGKVASFGVSVNRWEPDNCLDTLKTGHVDAVQVIYNIFDQAPVDNLFPLCRELDIAVIARVPFDEGTLTGTMSRETTFEKDDWRGTYFVPENLNSSVEHADALKPLVPEGMTMAEMALRFILMNEDVATTIPGMRKARHVLANCATSDGKGLEPSRYQELLQHRWDRQPTSWSQ